VGTRLTLTPAPDYVLARDVCSYGYFMLAPNRWDPQRRALSRTLSLENGPATLAITQVGQTPGARLAAEADRRLSPREQTEAKRLLIRMLRLDEDVTPFHQRDPRWRASGRGRLLRSPTLFEDIVKTVTSCNVAWSGTRRMNEALCGVINPGFPSPQNLARRRPDTLRKRCGVGYRDRRLVELAGLFASGEVEAGSLEDSARPDEDVHAALLGLPGVGPYAAANIMQHLGRYGWLAIDTESVRHGRVVLGLDGEPAEIERQVRAHYESFGDQRFRSYWFELWTETERERGPAWTWSV